MEMEQDKTGRSNNAQIITSVSDTGDYHTDSSF